MDVVIHQALFSTLLAAVESLRPELLAAHTKRYAKKVPPPYNANTPVASIVLGITKAEIDYDIRGSGASVEIAPGILKLRITFDAAVTRTRGSNSEEARFQLPLELQLQFNTSDGTRYPLTVTDALLTNLEPAGLRSTLSWILAETLSDATDEMGLPALVTLIKNELQLLLLAPDVRPGRINLQGQLKELT